MFPKTCLNTKDCTNKVSAWGILIKIKFEGGVEPGLPNIKLNVEGVVTHHKIRFPGSAPPLEGWTAKGQHLDPTSDYRGKIGLGSYYPFMGVWEKIGGPNPPDGPPDGTVVRFDPNHTFVAYEQPYKKLPGGEVRGIAGRHLFIKQENISGTQQWEYHFSDQGMKYTIHNASSNVTLVYQRKAPTPWPDLRPDGIPGPIDY